VAAATNIPCNFIRIYMFSIDLDCAQDAKDLLIADLWEAGCLGVVELEDRPATARVRVFFGDDVSEAEIAGRFGGTPEPADNRDWVAFAREHLHPMEIGERIFVVPEWRSEPTPPGRIRIEVNAGLAFGTGAHETTRLCLEALERLIRPGMAVADVGTGSGILAEAAIKLGAARVFACDTDPQATETAKENLARAGVVAPVFTGSADAIADQSADLLLANISPAWVAALAPDWARILKPRGRAILSGFESADLVTVGRALRDAGLTIEGEFAENEWRMLEAGRPTL
jgi:ribosomal protein L11 methyltransferase